MRQSRNNRAAESQSRSLRRRTWFARMILPGDLELPNPSPKKFARATRTPCFSSTSPRSCKHGCHSLCCARSSAIRLERRMWPASPQSMTRCAILIPAPAIFDRSFTSRPSLPDHSNAHAHGRGCSPSLRLISCARAPAHRRLKERQFHSIPVGSQSVTLVSAREMRSMDQLFRTEKARAACRLTI